MRSDAKKTFFFDEKKITKMGGYFNRNIIMLTTSKRSMLCSEGKGLRVRELSVGHEQDTSKPQQPQNGWWDYNMI